MFGVIHICDYEFYYWCILPKLRDSPLGRYSPKGYSGFHGELGPQVGKLKLHLADLAEVISITVSPALSVGAMPNHVQRTGLQSMSQFHQKLETMGQCILPPRHVLPVSRSVSGFRIRDPDRHQNLNKSHCQPSLKILYKSIRKFLRKVANRQTDRQTKIDITQRRFHLGGGIITWHFTV